MSHSNSRRTFVGIVASILANMLVNSQASACWCFRRRARGGQVCASRVVPATRTTYSVATRSLPWTAYLQILRCDNAIRATVTNGAGETSSVFNEYLDNDPDLSAVMLPIELTKYMSGFGNYLDVVGTNGPKSSPTQHNPWHIKYNVYKSNGIDPIVYLAQVDASSNGQDWPSGEVHRRRTPLG
jgi:hypothetical protein